MKQITTWTELLFSSMQAFAEQVMRVFPNVLGALFILLIGWLIAKLISKGIVKLLKVTKFDTLADKVNTSELLEKGGIKLTASELIAKFVYLMIMLLVFITACDTLGWTTVSNEISHLIGLLPTILTAVVIFIIGTYFATFVRDIIKGATSSIGISAGSIIGNVVFYILMAIVSITALQQAGIDTSVLQSNIILILGAILIAAAISYGFASREILSNVLASFFTRNTFTKGKVIAIDDIEGVIIDANNISITVQTATDKVIIPTHQLISNRVRLK
jgi:hypothetical protein